MTLTAAEQVGILAQKLANENAALRAELAEYKQDADRFKGIANMWLWETINEREEHADARRRTQHAFRDSSSDMGATECTQI